MDTVKFLNGFEAFIKEAGLDAQAAYTVRYCLPLINLEQAIKHIEKQAGVLSEAAEGMREDGAAGKLRTGQEAAELDALGASKGAPPGEVEATAVPAPGATPATPVTPVPTATPAPSLANRAVRAVGRGAVNTVKGGAKLAGGTALLAGAGVVEGRMRKMPVPNIPAQTTNAESASPPGLMQRAYNYATGNPLTAAAAVGLPLGAAGLAYLLDDKKQPTDE